MATDRAAPPAPLAATDPSSFPSAPAAYAVTWIAVAVAISRVLPNLAWRFTLVVAAVVIAALVGLTSLYLRVSWLSDVTGGWAVGAGVFSVCGLVALIVGHVRENASDGPRHPAPEPS